MIEVKRVYSEGVATVHLGGEFDLSGSDSVRTVLLEIIRETDMDLVIDLAEVGYIDSSAVAILIEGYKAGKEKGTGYVLVNASERVLKVLRLTRLDRFFDMYPSLEAAYAALGDKGEKKGG